MKVYVNDRNEIKDVHNTTDSSLLEVVINDETNPFADWSIAKICCYRVDVREGVVCMFTPYVNTLIIEQLDKLGLYGEATKGIVNVVIGADTEEMKAAEQARKAMQMYAQTLTDEEAMEVATMYPQYEVGKAYKEKEMFTYGVNSVGDPQLYRVVQAHTSQEDWKPDTTASLYTPIGLNDDGYPIWAQPTGAHDAYNKGDIVYHKGTLYISTIDGNAYAPDVYGWEVYEK
jgi:hypothetical protein